MPEAGVKVPNPVELVAKLTLPVGVVGLLEVSKTIALRFVEEAGGPPRLVGEHFMLVVVGTRLTRRLNGFELALCDESPG